MKHPRVTGISCPMPAPSRNIQRLWPRLLSVLTLDRDESKRLARRHSRSVAKREREESWIHLYRRQSDLRRCKRLYMARCKGGLFDAKGPIMRRYIRRASVVNTTSLSLSLSPLPFSSLACDSSLSPSNLFVPLQPAPLRFVYIN